MVMAGMKGISLECEACGHEDAIFFRSMDLSAPLKELAFRIKGYKTCPECGGKMKEDKQKRIVF